MRVQNTPRYDNLRSRLLIGPLFRNQWFIPDPPPRWIARALQAYERWVLHVSTAGIRIDRPIFIISLPRSGSSLLQDILCTHPDAAFTTHAMHVGRTCLCGIESIRRRLLLNARGERFLADSVDIDAGSPADPVAIWSEWLRVDPYEPLRREGVAFVADDLTDAERETIREGIRRVLWCFDPRTSRFICKNPALLPHIRVLNGLFPDARFVFLVRDARMTANSMLKLRRLCSQQLEAIRRRTGRDPSGGRGLVPYPWLPNLPAYLHAYGPDDIRTAAHLWDDSIRFMDEVRGELGAVLDVRYEDIVSDAPAQLGRILEFCGLAPVPSSHAPFWSRLASVGVLRHTNPEYGQADLVAAICRETMLSRGYLPAGG